MVVASREKGSPGRGAQRCCVKPCVAQPCLCKAVEIRCWNLTTECAPLSEPTIVDQDNQNVGSTVRSLGDRDQIRLRVLVSASDGTLEWGLRCRQDLLRLRRSPHPRPAESGGERRPRRRNE